MRLSRGCVNRNWLVGRKTAAITASSAEEHSKRQDIRIVMPRSSLWAEADIRKKKICENRLRKIPGTKYNFNLSFWSRKQQFFFLKCRLNVEPCFAAQLWRSLEDILFHVWPSADPSGIGYPVSLSQASVFLSKERTKGSILKWVLFFFLFIHRWISRWING